MKYLRAKKYIGFDDLEAELSRIKSLVEVIDNEYFGHSKEYHERVGNRGLLVYEYERYQNLMFICWGLLQDMGETLLIVQQNYETVGEFSRWAYKEGLVRSDNELWDLVSHCLKHFQEDIAAKTPATG